MPHRPIESEARVRLCAAALMITVMTAPAWATADELADYHGAVAAAYGHYRSALFYLRTGNAAPAMLELDKAGSAWQALVQRYGEQPPAAYADDPSWQDSLAEIEDRLRDGMAAIQGGDLGDAQETLKPVRRSLGALRARSGVRVFSDCVDEATRRMDALWRYRNALPDFGRDPEVAALRRAARDLGHQVQLCEAEADAETRADPRFRDVVDGMAEALARIETALDQHDELLLINTLRELRAFDRMLWLQFG